MERKMRRATLVALAVACGVPLLLAGERASAFPAAEWSVEAGDRLEVKRSHYCFPEGRAADGARPNTPAIGMERSTTVSVDFSREVSQAEVFLSGFNMWYTRRGHDHELVKDRVDVMIERIGQTPDEEEREPGIGRRRVKVKVIYSMVDQDPRGQNDYNKACIGFTVIAKTAR